MAKALDQLGPHLLGRKVVPDYRDWTLAKLEAAAAYAAGDADKTVRQLRDEGKLTSWWSVLAFWKWIKAFFAPTPPAPSGAVEWSDPIQLDQGQTPHCVGFGWAGWGDALPIADVYHDDAGHAIYYEAKVIDGEPGAEDGSSVRSGAKAMHDRGRLAAYAFLTLDEAKAKIHDGPLVVGSDWTDGMFTPDPTGLVRPTGSVAGGHCYLMLGYDPSSGRFKFQNSWGSGWGAGGRFFIEESDFGKLLSSNGEVCFAAELLAAP